MEARTRLISDAEEDRGAANVAFSYCLQIETAHCVAAVMNLNLSRCLFTFKQEQNREANLNKEDKAVLFDL